MTRISVVVVNTKYCRSLRGLSVRWAQGIAGSDRIVLPLGPPAIHDPNPKIRVVSQR